MAWWEGGRVYVNVNRWKARAWKTITHNSKCNNIKAPPPDSRSECFPFWCQSHTPKKTLIIVPGNPKQCQIGPEPDFGFWLPTPLLFHTVYKSSIREEVWNVWIIITDSIPYFDQLSLGWVCLNHPQKTFKLMNAVVLIKYNNSPKMILCIDLFSEFLLCFPNVQVGISGKIIFNSNIQL